MDKPKVVYAIKHNVTKRIYIGSSRYPKRRFSQHLSMLRNGKHIVEDMQKDFDEYGEDFEFFILCTISDYQDRNKEYEFMAFFETHIRGKGYNYKDHVNFGKLKEKQRVEMRERLKNLVSSLTDEEAEWVLTYVRIAERPLSSGKETK